MNYKLANRPELSFCFFKYLFFSETIMFLHEIFHQGLKARIANWPTLILGKLLYFLLLYFLLYFYKLLYFLNFCNYFLK